MPHKFLILLFFSSLLAVTAQDRRTIYLSDEKGNIASPGIELQADFRPNGPLIDGITDSSGKFVFYHSGAFKLIVLAKDSVPPYEHVYKVLDTIIYVKLKGVFYSSLVNPITVTGIFKQRISDGLQLTRVITKEKINLMAAQNLGDVLQNEANISLGQDPLLGTSAIVQGIGGQDIKILLNGIPIIGRLNGNVDLSQILVSNIERIEIIEGPMSVIYGTDALGGVINIITKTPVQKANGQFNMFTDNLNNFNLDGSVNFAVKKKLPITLGAGRYYFGGKDFDANTRNFDWKPKTKIFLTGNAIFKRKRFTHRLNINYFREDLLDRSDAYYNLNSVNGYNSNYYTSRMDNQLLSSIKLSKHNSLDIQNAFNLYQRRKSTVLRDLATGAETPVVFDGADTSIFKYLNSRGFFIHENSLKPKYKYIVGYDLNTEYSIGKRILGNLSSIRDLAFFGTVEYTPFKSFQVKPSLRIISNSRFGDYFPNSKVRFAPLIPALQMKYNLTEHLNFRGSFSRGYRAPSLKEMFFYFVDLNHNVQGNQNLQPETSDNFILSFDYRHTFDKKTGKSTIFSFSLFNNKIRDKIQLALRENSFNAYTYINIGQYLTQGVTTNFEYNSLNYGTSLTSSLITVADEISRNDSANQNYYVLLQLAWNLSYKFPKHNLSVTWFSRYTSKQRGYTESSKLYTLPRYYIADLIVQKKFPKQGFDVSTGCKNMFNVTSLQTNGNVAIGPHNTNSNIQITPGRVFFLKIAYNLK